MGLLLLRYILSGLEAGSLGARGKQGFALPSTGKEPLCFHDIDNASIFGAPVLLLCLPSLCPCSPFALSLCVTLCHLLMLEGHQALG